MEYHRSEWPRLPAYSSDPVEMSHGRTIRPPPPASWEPENSNPPTDEHNSLLYGDMYSAKKIPEPTVRPVFPDHNKSRATSQTSSAIKRKIYWVTPVSAIALFLIGLGTAFAHYAFLSDIHNTPVGNQTWTQRYSLALAFVFKASLAASISISAAQFAWSTLRRTRNGLSIPAIDAMFQSGSSLPSFINPTLWKSALGTALMAACIWIMPLTAVVAPTALTVGSTTIDITDPNCIVPTLEWAANRSVNGHPDYTRSRALFAGDYTGTSFGPSVESQRIAATVLNAGAQAGWTSPCGSDCTYNISFTGPSWQCTRTEDIDDPRAPWMNLPNSYLSPSYWYPEGPDLIINETEFDYFNNAPIYYAGLNGTSNEFWVGFAAGFTRGLTPYEGHIGETLRDILDLQAFICQIYRSSYTVHVSFVNGSQTNTVQQLSPSSAFEIPGAAWGGDAHWQGPEDTYIEQNALAIMDLVGVFTPMVDELSGSIDCSEQQSVVYKTGIGLIPSLISNLPLDYMYYGSEAPYMPLTDVGTLIENLAANVTISLMSNPALLVTNTTTTTCNKTSVQAVWEFNWLPLVAAYGAGLAAALTCLIFGTYALFTNGVAHDASFSSILRTTRNQELDRLVPLNDVGALPLSKDAREEKLKFLDPRGDNNRSGYRTGFVLGT